VSTVPTVHFICTNCDRSGDATSVIAAATVIAAVAALATIYFAQKTVQEAVASRREGRSAHDEQMAQGQRAISSQMSQISAATVQASIQHQTEMKERA
jgi:hypothetical protein